MADNDKGKRRGGKPFKNGNTTANGDYVVGKGRPPAATRFVKGDGRPRGRRSKGTKNFETDFNEELAALVSVTVNGKARKVSNQRAILMRLTDNARRGQNPAIRTLLEYRLRLAELDRDEGGRLHASDADIIEAFIQRHFDLPGAVPFLPQASGDPETNND